VTGASPGSTGRGQAGGGEPTGFDFVEVRDGGAVPSADATDRVDAGVEPSRWSTGFDRAVGRGTAALGLASARLGRTGIALLTVVAMAGFVAVIAATSRRPVIEQPPQPARVPVAASGCPNVSRCATRDVSSGPLATQLGALVHLTSLYAWSTFDINTGQVYRTQVIASNESEEYALASQCLPDAPLPKPQPIRVQHIASGTVNTGIGPYAYLTTTVVRQPDCSFLINAVVPETKVVSDPVRHRSTIVPDSDSVLRATIALAVLVRSPGIWVS
jgi:hypothetical protein